MKTLDNYITEKLKLNKDIKIIQNHFEGSPEELSKIVIELCGFDDESTEYKHILNWIQTNEIIGIEIVISKRDHNALKDNFELSDEITDKFIINDKRVKGGEETTRDYGKWILNDANCHTQMSGTSELLRIQNPDFLTDSIIVCGTVDYKKRYGSLG
ncbi:MAG: hypothetical protein IJH39_12730 [Clostridia bacterium]|nr:hypothetical protein [Clostridia bacterium]